MRSIFVLGSLVLSLGLSASAGPVTQDLCGGPVSVEVFAQKGNDVLENLLFADGSLWVSDGNAGGLLRYAPDGSSTLALPLSSPGGLVQHPADGLIYAGVGNSIANAALRTGAASVVRFDPANPSGTVTAVASGFNMPNGMTVLPNGDLVISNDFDRGLIRIPRANPASWSELASIWGTNGLVVDPAGQHLYAAVTFDSRSPIYRVDLSDGSAEVAAQLTVGGVSVEPAVHTDPDLSRPLVGVKGLDDMTRDVDGTLFVVANGMGELLKVDPLTGAACLVTGGLINPSSVRIAPENGPFADGNAATLDLYVTEFSGAIRIVRAPV